MGGTRYCCIVGCKKSQSRNGELTFYSFPTRNWEIKQRNEWIKAIRRMLCLSTHNLTPLFKLDGKVDEYSSILFLTTGLKIEPNDGLPQQICVTCTNAVKSAINLRNRSQITEIQLKEKHEHNNENKTEKEQFEQQITDKSNENDEINEDCEDIDGLQDLIQESDSSVINDVKTRWLPDRPVKKVSKKEQHQMHLNLVEGELNPNGPVTCKICKTTVSKWACFVNHAKLHLGFNFVCEFCGKSFVSTWKLHRHCRSHHGMKKELKCQHCSYLALDNAQMNLHIRRVHSGERPYICDVCTSSFYSRRCLVQHIESHRTVADVQCTICPRVFKSHRALSRHRYSAHAHATCPHCARVFTRKYIRKHMRTHQGNDVGD